MGPKNACAGRWPITSETGLCSAFHRTTEFTDFRGRIFGTGFCHASIRFVMENTQSNS